jgi:hypothetical protein
MGVVSQPLLEARARVLHDLAARGLDTAAAVSVVDEVVSSRRWWLEQWAGGAPYLACLVAQDVQEALLEQVGRWPACTVSHDADDPHHVDEADDAAPHELHVTPDLGEDPHWVCERSGVVVAPVGALGPN